MLRELNENEMEMVSGGLGYTNPYESGAARGMNGPEVLGGIGYGGDGWGPDGDRGFFEQVGAILENPFTESGAYIDGVLAAAADLAGYVPTPAEMVAAATFWMQNGGPARAYNDYVDFMQGWIEY